MAKASSSATVRVLNRGRNTYTHDAYAAAPGAFADIPKSLYELWKDNTEFGQKVIVLASELPDPVTKNEADEKLAAENEDLRKKLAAAEKLLEQATKPSALG